MCSSYAVVMQMTAENPFYYRQAFSRVMCQCLLFIGREFQACNSSFVILVVVTSLCKLHIYLAL